MFKYSNVLIKLGFQFIVMFTLCTVQLEKAQFQEKRLVSSSLFLSISGETLPKTKRQKPEFV